MKKKREREGGEENATIFFFFPFVIKTVALLHYYILHKYYKLTRGLKPFLPMYISTSFPFSPPFTSQYSLLSLLSGHHTLTSPTLNPSPPFFFLFFFKKKSQKTFSPQPHLFFLLLIICGQNQKKNFCYNLTKKK